MSWEYVFTAGGSGGTPSGGGRPPGAGPTQMAGYTIRVSAGGKIMILDDTGAMVTNKAVLYDLVPQVASIRAGLPEPEYGWGSPWSSWKTLLAHAVIWFAGYATGKVVTTLASTDINWETGTLKPIRDMSMENLYLSPLESASQYFDFGAAALTSGAWTTAALIVQLGPLFSSTWSYSDTATWATFLSGASWGSWGYTSEISQFLPSTEIPSLKDASRAVIEGVTERPAEAIASDFFDWLDDIFTPHHPVDAYIKWGF